MKEDKIRQRNLRERARQLMSTDKRLTTNRELSPPMSPLSNGSTESTHNQPISSISSDSQLMKSSVRTNIINGNTGQLSKSKPIKELSLNTLAPAF